MKITKMLAALTFAVGLAGGVAVAADPPSGGAAEERFERLEREIERLRAELSALRQSRASEGGDAAVEELDAKIEALTREIERLKLGEAAVTAEESRFGLGPAASKVYRAEPGVSIGGYGEILYEAFASEREDGAASGKKDSFDALRAIVYFGYKFDERFVFNSEIEFEHALAGEGQPGEVAVEFLNVDYLARPEWNLRGGLVLVPMGFLNELHEPPIFHGARRPDVERTIIPATWRELGLGAFGDAGPLSYRVYLVNGLDSSGYSSSGIRSGRQGGAKATAEDFALTGRVDWTATPGLLVGASFFAGDSAQGRSTPEGESFDGRTTVWDVHAEWRARGFDLRGLWAQTRISDAREINLANGLSGSGSVGSRQEGWYVQAGWDILSLRPGTEASLTPFVRIEELDTQKEVPAGFARNPARDREILTFGIDFKPIGRVVVKTEYQWMEDGAGTGVDQWNVALGYLF